MKRFKLYLSKETSGFYDAAAIARDTHGDIVITLSDGARLLFTPRQKDTPTPALGRLLQAVKGDVFSLLRFGDPRADITGDGLRMIAAPIVPKKKPVPPNVRAVRRAAGRERAVLDRDTAKKVLALVDRMNPARSASWKAEQAARQCANAARIKAEFGTDKPLLRKDGEAITKRNIQDLIGRVKAKTKP